MEPSATIFKTAKGVEEIATKKYKLPSRTRTLLILIDGVKTLAVMSEMAIKLGLPAAQIDELIEQGFVEVKAAPAAVLAGSPAGAGDNLMPSPSVAGPGPPANEYEAFRIAKQFMNDTIVNSLGIKAFFFTLKLEKCSNRQELSDLLQQYTKALAKSSGVEEAEVLTQRARVARHLNPLATSCDIRNGS